MAVPLFALALIGLLGLTVGSFLNVIIYRVPRGESLLFPNSHCPACDTAIKRRHNIPLFSWLALRGKCASCRAPISARYPAVEAATAALFVALTLEFGLGAQLPAYLYLVCIAVILVSIGLDAQQLPGLDHAAVLRGRRAAADAGRGRPLGLDGLRAGRDRCRRLRADLPGPGAVLPPRPGPRATSSWPACSGSIWAGRRGPACWSGYSPAS